MFFNSHKNLIEKLSIYLAWLIFLMGSQFIERVL